MAFTPPWQLLGIWVSGDVGGITIYTDKNHRKVAFPKAPPDKPPSPEQVAQRARFKTAQANWKALTLAEKTSLEEVTKTAYIVMTGQNLFMSVSMTNDQAGYETLQRQTGIVGPVIGFVP